MKANSPMQQRFRHDHRFLATYVASQARRHGATPADIEGLRALHADRTMPFLVRRHPDAPPSLAVIDAEEPPRLLAFDLVYGRRDNTLDRHWTLTSVAIDSGIADAILWRGFRTVDETAELAQALAEAEPLNLVASTHYARTGRRYSLRNRIERRPEGPHGSCLRADDAAHVGLAYLGSPRLEDAIAHNTWRLITSIPRAWRTGMDAACDAIPNLARRAVRRRSLQRLLSNWLFALFPAEAVRAYHTIRTSPSPWLRKSGTAGLLTLVNGGEEALKRRLQWIRTYPLTAHLVLADPEVDRLIVAGTRARAVLDRIWDEHVQTCNRPGVRALLDPIARRNTTRKLAPSHEQDFARSIATATRLPREDIPATSAQWSDLAQLDLALSHWSEPWWPKTNASPVADLADRYHTLKRTKTRGDSRIDDYIRDLSECRHKRATLSNLLDIYPIRPEPGPQTRLAIALLLDWEGQPHPPLPGVKAAARRARRWQRTQLAIAEAHRPILAANDRLVREVAWHSPDSGIPGVKPVTSMHGLDVEAQALNHCVWSYTTPCLNGTHIYSLETDEGRATLAVLEPRPSSDPGTPPRWRRIELARDGNRHGYDGQKALAERIIDRLNEEHFDLTDIQTARIRAQAAFAFLQKEVKDATNLASWRLLWASRNRQPSAPTPAAYRALHGCEDPEPDRVE